VLDGDTIYEIINDHSTLDAELLQRKRQRSTSEVAESA